MFESMFPLFRINLINSCKCFLCRTVCFLNIYSSMYLLRVDPHHTTPATVAFNLKLVLEGCFSCRLHFAESRMCLLCITFVAFDSLTLFCVKPPRLGQPGVSRTATPHLMADEISLILVC